MQNDINDLLSSVNETINPGIISDCIDHFLYDRLRDKEISLYEAYSINGESIRFARLWYTQKAWSGWVQISTCLSLLNQKLLADIFGDKASSELYRKLAIEAYNLNREKRKHYIMDRFFEFLAANENVQLLKELEDIRYNYKQLSFNKGPYHCEEFPSAYYSPEKILLESDMLEFYRRSKVLTEEIEDLIVELNLI